MNKYYKAMLSMMLVFILGFFSVNVLAEKNCVELPPEMQDHASMIPIARKDLDPNGKPKYIETRDGVIKAWINQKTRNIEYEYKLTKLEQSKDADGNPQPFDKDRLQVDAEAKNNQEQSKFYGKGGMGDKNLPEDVLGRTSKTYVEKDANGKEYLVMRGSSSGSYIDGNRQEQEFYTQAGLMWLDYEEGRREDKPTEKEIRELYKNLTNNNESTESKKWEDKAVNTAKKGLKANQEALMENLSQRGIVVALRYNYPPQKICDDDTPEAERACAEWNKDLKMYPVTCDDGTATGYKAPCIIEKTEDFKSSYTTTTPNNSDPWKRDETGLCDGQMPGYLQFSEIMNPFGDRTFSNNDILNNGINNFNKKRPMDKFNNNYWKTSYRGEGREIRKWNPFVDGNKLSGIPYKVAWTEHFNGWYDQVYSINPIITESINHVKEMEARNSRVASKYNQNGNKFKIFLKAPNKSMDVTALNLNTNTWDKAKTTNGFCTKQYWIKIEPRYDIYTHEVYQKYDWHHNSAPSYDYRCKCVKWESYRACIDWDDDDNCIERETRYRCARDELEKFTIGVNEKYPDGETTKGPFLSGTIPPVYKQRREYKYRTGALVEYHTMTRPYGKTTMTPVPNSKDTSKMKSGYGFGYTSGIQIITDYDRAPSTYKFNPVIIRPNKTTNLDIRTNNYKSSYGLFDSNVRYNKAKNAPERSSSIDKTFIEETLRGGLTKTTFKPSAISNVEKVDGKVKDFNDVKSLPVNQSRVRKTAIKWGEMTSIFKISSDPAKYYHAYWKTKGEPNLIPAYKPGPLHYVYLDYPSGNDYTVASLDTINLNGKGFFATGMNTGSIKIVGNMWEDSFSRPNFKK